MGKRRDPEEWEGDVDFCTIMAVVVPEIYQAAKGLGASGRGTPVAARNKMALIWTGYDHASILEAKATELEVAVTAMRNRARLMKEAAG